MKNLNQTFLGECISVNLERSDTLASIVSRISAARPRRDFSFRQSVQTSSVAYPSFFTVIYWDLYLRCKATGRGDHSPAQVLMLKTTGAHLHTPNTLLNLTCGRHYFIILLNVIFYLHESQIRPR